MDSHWGTPNHRKRKRRRGIDRPPLPAHLVLDNRLKGDVGYLSEDLFVELFPAHISSQANESSPMPDAAATNNAPLAYAAIKPHMPNLLLPADAISWTILPVKKSAVISSSKADSRSTLRFSPSTITLQSFVNALQKASPNRPTSGYQAGVDIQILDVVPIYLDTVVVTIDDVALKNLHNAHQEFNNPPAQRRRGSRSNLDPHHGSFKDSRSGLHNSSDSDRSDTAQWEPDIRKALNRPKLIHAGDLLPLDLPSHPITHSQPPPALVELCEPVTQGFVSPSTKIVVISSSKASKRPAPVTRSYVIPNGVSEEDEDTSNEQFYSAAEDKSYSPAPRRPSSSSETSEDPSQSEDPATSADEDTDLSDGEGDAIGLDLPMLPTQSSGVLSAFSSATPRPGNFGGGTGVATPGSVVSTYSTTSTIRGGSMSKGRLFDTQSLLAPIPDDVLHPKAPPDEDPEARIFIETTSLLKLGCFSGDWVRIEVASDNSLSALSSWTLAGLRPGEPQESRTAKVYALPGQAPSKPRYAIDRSGNRRSSLSMSMSQFDRPALKAYLSPLLLANLGNPSTVRIASLAPPQSRNSVRATPSKGRITSASLPPVAKEVTFMKLLTPVATLKSLDASFAAGVRRFFESRQRIVKNGDLIGIPIDADLGKAVFQGSTPEDEALYEEFLTKSGMGVDAMDDHDAAEVFWFRIGSVVPESSPDASEVDDEPSWGGVAVVKPGTTRMSQSGGSEQGKVPDTMHNLWAFYLGLKHLPAPSDGSIIPTQLTVPPKQFTSQTRRRLRELLSASTSPQAVHLSLPPIAILLASSQRHVGKFKTAVTACLDLGLHAFTIDAFDIINEAGGGGGDVKTAGALEARAERAMWCGSQYTALVIRHVEALTAERMAATLKHILTLTRVLIATTSDVEHVPEPIRSIFTNEIEMSAPDEGEREGLLRDILQDSGVPVAANVDLSSVALKTAALVAGDLEDVVDRAAVARRERLENLAHSTRPAGSGSDLPPATVRDIQIAGGESSRCITKHDFDVAVEAARKNFADAIGAPKIPNVTWDDVGGLTNVKDAVMETIQLPLERPELFAKGMKKRSGILFYGPPGTGKTLLAKAIATEFSLNFFSVKGPELLNMYIGESEANVRRVFQRARDARPCVVFFDELDSVAPKRGNQGDSGGVMDRIVSQLLAELDGMSDGEDGGGGVFVIGATNRPDLLDPALLRPGRFDKMLYLGVSDTHEKQLTILKALTRKFALHPSLSLATVAESLPFTYTGADLYALCSDAMLKAITRRAESVDAKVRALNTKRAAVTPPLQPISVAHFFDHLAVSEDTEVVVEESDFERAMTELVPSVSTKELEHYERVRNVFEMVEDAKNIPDKPKLKTNPGGGNKGKGKAFSNLSPTARDDDEFVIRTENLSIHDKVNGTGKGKGKAKQRAVYTTDGVELVEGFGDDGDTDEFLYSP